MRKLIELADHNAVDKLEMHESPSLSRAGECYKKMATVPRGKYYRVRRGKYYSVQ